MPTGNYNVSGSIGGQTIQASRNRTADNANSFNPTLPVGYAGELTTRTDDDTGTVTLEAGHAITTGMIVDIHWAGGVQYGVTVGTVSVNSMPFDLGVGDVLPIATTDVVVTPQVTITLSIDGDALSLMQIKAEYANPASTAKAHIAFHDVADDVIAELDLNANAFRNYDIEGGDANPFTGDPITYAKASNGSSTEVCTLLMGVLQDSTP